MDKVGGLGTASGWARNRDLANTATEVIERQPHHVAEAVIAHRNVAEGISETISSLEKRLSAVTRNEPPPATNGDGAKAVRPIRVDLAEAIDSSNMILEVSLYRLRSLLDRLEL